MRALFQLALFALFTQLPPLANAQDALSNAESALYTATQKRDVPGQLQAIQQIAEHYLRVERPKRALSYYRLGLETDPSEIGKARLLRQIAQVHLDMGEFANAQVFAQESIRILRAQNQLQPGVNTTGDLINCLITMAHIRLESLDFFQAQEDISEAFRLSKTLKDASFINKSHAVLVRLREKQGHVEGTRKALLEWAQATNSRGQKELALTQAGNTTALSLCEKNWKENNFAGALRASRSTQTENRAQTNPSQPVPEPALELCKAKSQLKLNRYQELLADYSKLPAQHPLLKDPGMQLLVSRSWMGLEQYEKAASVSKAALNTLHARHTEGTSQQTDLQFALIENLILIELQVPSSPASQNLIDLCWQAEQSHSQNNSPVWGECALANASAGKFDKALTYTELADLWFAEFGTPRQAIENRLIKALIQVELGQVEEGLLTVNGATAHIEKSSTEEWPGFERQSSEIQALAAEKKGEYDRAANFYKLALNAANTENNELEMERLATRLAALNAMANNKAAQQKATSQAESKPGTLSRMLGWFEQLRTPEYLRSLNPFKKKPEN